MSNADQYRLETPENIEVEYELAGLGSRFCAMLIDGLMLFLIVFLLAVLAAIVGIPAVWTGWGVRPASWIVAVILGIVLALISGGYFVLFELLMRGQTPGKRAMKIRVIRDDGTPVTANEVLVRNIIRLVDFLPFGYALGAIVMFPNPLSKRLGDLAAGTIVVKERQLDYRAEADKKYQLGPAVVAIVNSELTAEERRVLTGFLQRRIELLPKARAELAERLARPLHEKYGGSYHNAESYIQRLVEGRQNES